MDGLKFTNGWEDFVVAHDLRVGDIIIFRHEGEMVFHVTALGPSCCEIQYTSSPSHNINDNSHGPTNNIVIGNSSREKRKRVKNNQGKKVESSSDHSSFVANVTASSLSFDRLFRLKNLLYLPQNFARSNGFDKMSGEKIVLRNEEGRSWSLKLKYYKSVMHTFVKPGWTRFCTENGMNHGLYTFKLAQKSGPPVVRAEHRPKSLLNRSCYVGSVSPSSLIRDRLYLRRDFVKANGLDKGCSEIVLKNEWGRRWTLALNHYRSLNQTTIRPGWKLFCQENQIKAGDSFMFKLVKTREKPVLSLCPTDSNRDKTPLEFSEDSDDVESLSSDTSSGDESSESQKSEKESLGDKNITQVYLEMEEKMKMRASYSYSQDQFVILTLTPYAVKRYKLVS